MFRSRFLGVSLVALAAMLVSGLPGAETPAPVLPSALDKLPSDCEFVFGFDFRKFNSSSVESKVRPNIRKQIGRDVADFIESTGVELQRDIAYLVGAGRSEDKTRQKSVLIVTGSFDRERMSAYLRKSDPIEHEYVGKTVFMFPDDKKDVIERGVVLLSDREIAFGDLEYLKDVLDSGKKGKSSIMDNPRIAQLITGLNLNEMFWFAGDSSTISRAPLPSQLGTAISSVRSVAGTMNIADMITGKIVATASSPELAAKLVETVKGIIALGQISGDQNPGLKMLAEGLTVSQESARVRITMKLPATLIDRFNSAVQ